MDSIKHLSETQLKKTEPFSEKNFKLKLSANKTILHLYYKDQLLSSTNLLLCFKITQDLIKSVDGDGGEQ